MRVGWLHGRVEPLSKYDADSSRDKGANICTAATLKSWKGREAVEAMAHATEPRDMVR